MSYKSFSHSFDGVTFCPGAFFLTTETQYLHPLCCDHGGFLCLKMCFYDVLRSSRKILVLYGCLSCRRHDAAKLHKLQ
jgi:hypothetical protein